MVRPDGSETAVVDGVMRDTRPKKKYIRKDMPQKLKLECPDGKLRVASWTRDNDGAMHFNWAGSNPHRA